MHFRVDTPLLMILEIKIVTSQYLLPSVAKPIINSTHHPIYLPPITPIPSYPCTPVKRLDHSWVGRNMQRGSEDEGVYISSVKIYPTQRYTNFDSPNLTRLSISSRVSVVFHTDGRIIYQPQTPTNATFNALPATSPGSPSPPLNPRRAPDARRRQTASADRVSCSRRPGR